MDTSVILLIFLLFISSVIMFSGMKVVKSGERAIIEKLGVFDRILGEGLHFIIPFIDRVAVKIDMHEKYTTPKIVKIITKDDKKLSLEYRISYLVKDPKLFHYGMSNIDTSLHSAVFEVLRKEIPKITYEDFGYELENIENITIEILNEDVLSWGIMILKVAVEKKLS